MTTTSAVRPDLWAAGPAAPTAAGIPDLLLESISTIQSCVGELRDEAPWLGRGDRVEILESIARHATFVRGILNGLVRGLPPEVTAALDAGAW
ncbi:MAG TPA: hypothetical protein VFA11_08830 [Acidimicrobiales bacterium]|nr:hypothetical protein [Acidimicrobiales bacterium]